LTAREGIISPLIEVENLRVSGDAKVEGVLEAGTIKAQKIEGVEFTQTTEITNVTVISQPPEASLAEGGESGDSSQESGGQASPQARFIELISDKVEALRGIFDQLTAKTAQIASAVIENLQATTAHIADLITNTLITNSLIANNSISSPVADIGKVNSEQLTVDRLEIKSEGETMGEAVILKGETSVLITNSLITSHSRVFITPQVAVPVPLAVTKLTPADPTCPSDLSAEALAEVEASCEGGFTVEIAQPQEIDVPFHWWVVETVPSQETGAGQ